jgi:tRNA pseudouridine55 synthase
MNGIINVYKERGFTSFDVVAKLRGILHEKKIGHTGTLDPDATGVLPVCIGNATKVCELLTDKDKVYETVLHLGVATDTQDASGRILQRHEDEAAQLSEEEVRCAIESFVGGYEQIPPMYSALKVGGRKLCDLAREGIEVERKARPVMIYSIEIARMELPLVWMDSLERTRVSVFVREESHTLAEIEAYRDRGALDEILRPVDSVFENLPKAQVKPEAMRLLANGNPLLSENFAQLAAAPEDEMQLLVYDPDGRFYALYQYDRRKRTFKVRKMFGARI